MFVDAFDTKGAAAGDAAESNLHIAQHFVDDGYKVTVYAPGDHHHHHLEQTEDGIEIRHLPNPHFSYGNSSAVSASLAVHHLLQEKAFAVVYFEANSGVGYYPLLFRRLGIVCPDTRFIVGVNRPSAMQAAQQRAGTHNLSDAASPSVLAEWTKQEYMRAQSIEWADKTIFATSTLQNGLPGQMLPLPLTHAHRLEHKGNDTTDEVVFVGHMGTGGGLDIFLDAMDGLHQAALANQLTLPLPAGRFLNVVCLGELASIGQEDAVSYVMRRTASWTRFHVEIRSSPMHTGPVIVYLTHGPNSLAVTPLEGGISSYLLENIAFAGVPLVAPRTEQNVELLGNYDGLFVPGSTDDLQKTIAARISGQVAAKSANLIYDDHGAVLAYSNLLSEVSAAAPKCSALPTTNDTVSVAVHYPMETATVQELEGTLRSIAGQTYQHLSIVLVADQALNATEMAALNVSFSTHSPGLAWHAVTGPQVLKAVVSTADNLADHIVLLSASDYARADCVDILTRAALLTAADVIKAGVDVSGHAPTSLGKRLIPLGGQQAPTFLDEGYGQPFYFSKASLTRLAASSDGNRSVEALLHADQTIKVESVPEVLVWRHANLVDQHLTHLDQILQDSADQSADSNQTAIETDPTLPEETLPTVSIATPTTDSVATPFSLATPTANVTGNGTAADQPDSADTQDSFTNNNTDAVVAGWNDSSTLHRRSAANLDLSDSVGHAWQEIKEQVHHFAETHNVTDLHPHIKLEHNHTTEHRNASTATPANNTLLHTLVPSNHSLTPMGTRLPADTANSTQVQPTWSSISDTTALQSTSAASDTHTLTSNISSTNVTTTLLMSDTTNATAVSAETEVQAALSTSSVSAAVPSVTFTLQATTAPLSPLTLELIPSATPMTLAPSNTSTTATATTTATTEKATP
ncbi:hypothetical protein RI367_004639 [Sorochytrium milnesiophthora]